MARVQPGRGKGYGWGRPIDRGAAGRRQCPKCEARPGNPCGHWSDTRGWVKHKTYHRERIEAE